MLKLFKFARCSTSFSLDASILLFFEQEWSSIKSVTTLFDSVWTTFVKFLFVVVEQHKPGLQCFSVERNIAKYIPVFFSKLLFISVVIIDCMHFYLFLLWGNSLLEFCFTHRFHKKKQTKINNEPSLGFHTCIERLCFCKQQLMFPCFCASDLLVFMCAMFVQLGLGMFVTHLLLLCAVICVRSLAPR